MAHVLQLPGTFLFEASDILSEAFCAFPLFPSNLFPKLNVKTDYNHFLPDRLHIPCKDTHPNLISL
jgi:hypothetical protein